ncbi:MAG: hypothetical protein IKS74_00790 [Methanomicrobium sp.]|nr:hypothetical protein [Methanomicrobium sp.]
MTQTTAHSADDTDGAENSAPVLIGESLQETLRDILRHGCWDWNPTYSKFDITLGTLEETLTQLKKDCEAGAKKAIDEETESKFIDVLEYAKSNIEDCYAKITDILSVYEQIMIDIEEIADDGGFDEEYIYNGKWEVEL